MSTSSNPIAKAFATERPLAHQYAALVAIRDGVDTLVKRLAPKVLEYAEEVGSRSFTTPWGAVNIVQKDREFVIDRDLLLEQTATSRPDEVVTSVTHTLTPEEVLDLVREHRPDAIRETRTVRPSFVKYLTSRLKTVADLVVDGETGEVVEWARLGLAPEPYVHWPASKAQRAAKDYAGMLVEDGAAGLIDGLALLLPSSADA